MKGLVEYLAKALVDNPAPVEVFEASAEGATHEGVFRLKVAREDLGKVIGKKGRTAKAFRTLLAAAGAKQNLRVTLEILEPEGSMRGPRPDASTGSAPETAEAPREPDGDADENE